MHVPQRVRADEAVELGEGAIQERVLRVRAAEKGDRLRVRDEARVRGTERPFCLCRKMLGGASQTVSKIRVKCNGIQKNTHRAR